MRNISECFINCSTKHEYAKNYLKYISSLLENVDVIAVEKIIDVLENAAKNENLIYFIGNGGSAVTASHFARDIGIGTRSKKEKIFKTISLVDNMAVITAIANDEDYSKVFIRQLEAVLQKDDIVFALSVSGNSRNIIEAIEYAKRSGAVTIGCTGFDGGKLSKIVDIKFHVPTPAGEYGPVEDAFMILDHLITSYFQAKRLGISNAYTTQD